MSGHSATFTGDNVDEIRDLGVHVLEHPTQTAIIVFASEHALDPAGLAAPGQTVIVDDGGVRIAGVADTTPLPLPLPEDVLFDPSKVKVDDVLEYLRSAGDDQPEIDRVLAAERAGKARKSIIGTPPSPESLPPAPPQIVEDAALTAPHTETPTPDREDGDTDPGTEHDAE